MATIRIKGFTVVRDVFGTDVVELEVPEGQTVDAALGLLLARFGDPLRALLSDPATGTLTAFPITLNGEMIYSNLSGSRPVKDGDEMAIIFPIGGG